MFTYESLRHVQDSGDTSFDFLFFHIGNQLKFLQQIADILLKIKMCLKPDILFIIDKIGYCHTAMNLRMNGHYEY
jgi:hypothetical protein